MKKYKLHTFLIILCLCISVICFQNANAYNRNRFKRNTTTHNIKNKNNTNVGKYIKMGSYPQTATGQIQPIEWIILSQEGNKMLLLSKYGLDVKPFESFNNRQYPIDSANNWEYSEIRQWLNNDFYNQAFTEQEKKHITDFKGDNVFLLSSEEAETGIYKYFQCDRDRQCKPTEYAVANGAYYKGNCIWWLRSATTNPSYFGARKVDAIGFDGDWRNLSPTADDVAVRPALWINL